MAFPRKSVVRPAKYSAAIGRKSAVVAQAISFFSYLMMIFIGWRWPGLHAVVMGNGVMIGKYPVWFRGIARL
jgi:hypothetical protein